jgi:exopolysaccharide production protein ExoY
MERTHAIGIAEPQPEASLISAAPAVVLAEVSTQPLASAIPLNSTAPEEHLFAEVILSPEKGRAFDIAAAVFLLLLVLPLMILCALAVLGTSRGPLLFRQPRIGRNGQPFDCLKFRTMVEHADGAIDQVLNDSPEAMAEWQAVQKIRSDPRVTPVGIILRRYCLDELPQLFNVLRGDMSVVGPRPIVADEVDRFGVNFTDYCSVKPGITGLWQVSGRHLLSYQQRVELDAEYARSKCLSLDLRILWRTVPIVMLGDNG